MGVFGASEHDLQNQAEQHDRDMARLNQDIWLEQQEYLNAYNDPSQQVQRLEAAGINPNLAFSSVGSSGTASDSHGGTGTSQGYAAALGATAQRQLNKVTAARNLQDMAASFGDLDVKRYNASTQRAVANADIALKAEEKGLISEKKAGQIIENNVNSQWASELARTKAKMQDMSAEEHAANAAARTVESANNTRMVDSLIKVNDQKIKESIQTVEELKTRSGVNSELAKKYHEDMEYMKKLNNEFKTMNVDTAKATKKELEARASFYNQKKENANMSDWEKALVSAGVDILDRGLQILGDIIDKRIPKLPGSGKGSNENSPLDPNRMGHRRQTRTTEGRNARGERTTQTDQWDWDVPLPESMDY